MESAVRLVSSAAVPLVRELFTPQATQGTGQNLVAALVSFRGTQPTLASEDLERLAREFVRLGLGYRKLPRGEGAAVAAVLARTLAVMGELDTTDVQAVRLGPQDYARLLRSHRPGEDRQLSGESAWFHDSLLVAVCLHVLNLLIDRSSYLAETLPQRSHRIRQLVDLGDVAAVRRRVAPAPQDAAFEERYLRSVVEQFNRVMIYGIDLPNPNTPDSWPLDATYLSLGAEFDTPGEEGSGAEPVMPADRALAGQERVLLRGVAGSGKTTLVQWLAVCTARGELPEELHDALHGRIPLVLPVRRFGRDGFPAPDDFLRAVRHPLAEEAPDGWVIRVLAEERALLLVDGIDEVTAEQRDELRDALRRVLRIYSGNFCLVTARPPAVDAEWLADEGFNELTLAPMNRDQVAAFIRVWHAAARTDEGRDHAQLEAYNDRLVQSIPLYRELRGLATNPLMCGLICALNRDRSGSLPKGRRELYEAAMEMLLQRRDPERRVHADTVDLQRTARERLLRKLAYRMLVEQRALLDEAAALEEITDCLPAIPAAKGQGSAEEIFGHLLQRTGLLREQAEGAVEFVHRTVQDYLAAKEAVERGNLELLLDHAHEPEWEEVLRMAVAHARPEECAQLLSGLIAPGHTGMQRNRRRLLAAACLEHVTELDPEIHTRIRRETRHMVRPSNVAAARGLGWVGPIVLEMLPDPEDVSDDEAHRLAVTATRINDDAAVDYLARLRQRASLPLQIRAELVRGWRHFDTERYAEDVVRHLDAEGLYFAVTDRVELAALREMGGRACVQVAGRFAPKELLEGLVREELRHLWLAYDLGVSMEWLGEFPSLATLRVNPRLPRVSGVPEGIRIIS